MQLNSHKCIDVFCSRKATGEVDGYPFCFFCALKYKGRKFSSQMRLARIERRGY